MKRSAATIAVCSLAELNGGHTSTILHRQCFTKKDDDSRTAWFPIHCHSFRTPFGPYRAPGRQPVRVSNGNPRNAISKFHVYLSKILKIFGMCKR